MLGSMRPLCSWFFSSSQGLFSLSPNLAICFSFAFVRLARGHDLTAFLREAAFVVTNAPPSSCFPVIDFCSLYPFFLTVYLYSMLSLVYVLFKKRFGYFMCISVLSACMCGRLL